MKMELVAFGKDSTLVNVNYADHVVIIPSAKVLTGYNAKDNDSFVLPLDEMETIRIRTIREEDMP